MNKERYETSIAYLRNLAETFELIDVCKVVLENKNFELWSGSGIKEHHHYGKHGLIIHTAEVVKLCLTNNETLNYGIDPKKIFLAALFHDAGKMWDYEPLNEDYEEWKITDHKFKIHHISRSSLLFNQAASNFFDQKYIDEILHAILAHHGFKEWGSPVTPKTALAWLLHLCDNISAKLEEMSLLDLRQSNSW